jgi:hypothetical protein
MKNLCFLFLGCLLASCSTVRQLERAQRLVAEHQQAVPPDTVFKYLLAANPKLKERTTRTVTKTVVVHDTVRVSKTVYLPAPARAVSPLVDSLIRAAGKQLRVKDSLAFAMRLRAALAARPKVRNDTLKQRLGNLLIRTWIDKVGAAHTTITNLKENTVVVQRVVPAPRRPALPRSEAAPPPRIWDFVNAHLGAIVAVLLIGLLWVLLILFVRRRKPASPYSNKP